MHPLVQVVLLALVVTAAILDWKTRRIPNKLNIAGLALGLSLNAALTGWHGLGLATLGLMAALVVYLPLYCLRGMSAGDVKLMAAVGALTGPGTWLSIFLVTAIVGGVVSLCVVIYKRRLAHTFLNLSFLTAELVQLRQPALIDPELDVHSAEGLRLPHGISIALGCIIFVASSIS